MKVTTIYKVRFKGDINLHRNIKGELCKIKIKAKNRNIRVLFKSVSYEIKHLIEKYFFCLFKLK